jgi:uncharacterized repeat protein (TIGR03806 family)
MALALAGAASAERGPPTPDMKVILAERPAQKLSAYRLFVNDAPTAGVLPYDLATPLFSDYASKARYVFVPAGQKARFRAEGAFEFPVGTVLVKTFGFPDTLALPQTLRKIETRLLVRRAEGWDALAYVWDAEGRDAQLSIAGAVVPVRFTDSEGVAQNVAHAVPNKNQCKGCHALDNELTPIGTTARHLDRTANGGAASTGQLAAWVATGILDAAPTQAGHATGLEARARAYLDVNCAHCHSPRGPASNSGLDLRYEQNDPSQWGVRKRPVAAGRASGGLLYAIDPGYPERSILLHRMQSTDPGVMMPELGRTLVHREGVALIREWIAAMDATGRVAEPH